MDRTNKPFFNKPLKIEGKKEKFSVNQKWKVKRIWEKVIRIEYEQRRVNMENKSPEEGNQSKGTKQILKTIIQGKFL